MGRPEDRFRNGTKGSISNNNNSVFNSKKENVFGKNQEKELVPKHEKDLSKKREPLIIVRQESEPIAEEKKVFSDEEQLPVNKEDQGEEVIEFIEQVTNGLVDVNELVQSGVDYLDTLLASKKVSVPTPKKDHKSTDKSNQPAPEYFANKRAKKRLRKVSVKFIVNCVIIINLVSFVREIASRATTEDLYMYGYGVKDSENQKVLDFVVDYNSTHENSYLVTSKDIYNGSYHDLFLIIENEGYKEWVQTNPGLTFIDYYSSLDEIGIYNLQLESYKLGDELAVSMKETFGNTLNLSIYEGLTTDFEDSVYDFFVLESKNFNLVLSYEFYASIQRVGNFPNNSPDLFVDTEVNVLPEYWGLTNGN